MALSTTNILIYSAQILVLISAAAIGAAIFRLPLARARLAYWRVVVVACLILPWVSALVSVPPPLVSQHLIQSIAFGITAETGSGSSLFTRSGAWSAESPAPAAAQHACLAGPRRRPLEARHGAVD